MEPDKENKSLPEDNAAGHTANALPASSMNASLAKSGVSTNTLYYLHSYSRPKSANGESSGARAEQGVFQPRREVGTRQMIEEASAAREGEKVVLDERIKSLKEEIAALTSSIKK